MQTVMLTVVLCKCRCIHTFTGFLVQFCSGVYGWVVKTEETIRTSLSQRGAKVSSILQGCRKLQKCTTVPSSRIIISDLVPPRRVQVFSSYLSSDDLQLVYCKSTTAQQTFGTRPGLKFWQGPTKHPQASSFSGPRRNA